MSDPGLSPTHDAAVVPDLNAVLYHKRAAAVDLYQHMLTDLHVRANDKCTAFGYTQSTVPIGPQSLADHDTSGPQHCGHDRVPHRVSKAIIDTL